MTNEQAQEILKTCTSRVDFTSGKALGHVILKGWFDVREIQAVLTLLLRAQERPNNV